MGIVLGDITLKPTWDLRGFLIRGLPGYMVFLGYYLLVAYFRVPFYFTVDRVTSLYRHQSPLLGFLEFDLIFYLALMLFLLAKYPRDRVLLGLALAGGGGTVALRFLRLDIHSYLLLGASSVLAGARSHFKAKAKGILWGFASALVALEAGCLLSCLSYYALGRWTPLFFNILLKERLIWAPFEWIIVPVFFIAALSSWYFVLFKGAKCQEITGGIHRKRVLLYSYMLILILVALPHLPTVNPGFRAVSVDTAGYGRLFERVGNEGLWDTLARQPGRPLYTALLYWVWVLTGKRTVLLMDFLHPTLTICGIALVSHHVSMKRGGGGKYAPLMVPLGYTLTGFLGGGYQSNSLALIPGILALYMLPEDREGWTVLAALMTLTGLLHSWTYSMYSAAILALWVLKRRQVKKPLIALASSYVIVSLVDYLFDQTLRVAGTTAEPVITGLGYYLFDSWFNSLNVWVWNTLSNPAHFSLSLMSLDAAGSSLLTVAAPFLLVLPAELINRLVLNMPLNIPASKTIRSLPPTWRRLVILVLLVRVLSNLTGLTPYIPPA